MRSTGDPLIDEVEGFLSSHSLRDTTVVVAYSGGVDSAALLSALCSLRDRWLVTLVAAYFDHGIRPEPERELERRIILQTVSKLCVELETGGVEPGRLIVDARERGTGVEAYARTLRYRFLAEVAVRRGSHVIVTAHHCEDVAETVLLRLVQGAGLAGLAGIPYRRDLEPGLSVFRPLLNIHKESIIEYARSMDVSWVEDSTNASGDYDRNRIRHTVLPAVLQAFPNAVEAIVRFSRRNGAAASYISRAAAEILPWQWVENGLAIDSQRFWQSDPVLRVESVLAAINRLSPAERVPAAMLDTLRTPRQAGGIIFHGRGLLLYQLSGTLILTSDVAHQLESGYLSPVELPAAFCGTTNVLVRIPVATERVVSLTVNPAAIEKPLVARSWRSGDTLTVHGVTKTVKRLLPELGVARFLRVAVPILEDREGLLAVVGELVGGETRVADRANWEQAVRLHITFRGLASG